MKKPEIKEISKSIAMKRVLEMNMIAKALLVTAALISTPVSAATIIDGNNGLVDQIHSAGNQAPATTVFGKTQISQDGITFTSTSKLGINGNGYATVSDGDTNDGEVFDNLNLFLTTNPLGFTAVEFSIAYASQVLQGMDGLLSVTVDFLGGGSQTFDVITFTNPQNRDFQIKAEGNEVFSALRLDSNVQFDMIKQNDITLASATGAVPEPATWMMMMLGMGGIGFSLRRKNKTALRVRFA